MKYYRFLVLIAVFISPFSLASQEKEDKKESQQEVKYISNVVDDSTGFDDGLFNVYLEGPKIYFEIPDSLLDIDMLLVSRISKVPSNLSPYINAGSKTGQQVVRWQMHKEKILLRVKSYQNVSDPADPISLSVTDNNFEPIIAGFEIEASNRDSTSWLIEVSSLFVKDVKALSGINSRLRKEYNVKGLDASRTMVETVKSFPINIEVRHIMTYNAGSPPSQSQTETISLLMNQSFILLPRILMTPRIYDERVGWFAIRQFDYSSDALKSDEKRYIRRWKLVPKDLEAYMRGELVEPVKPIIYYLDPATPLKWRKFFRMGIEDWNECFESAGFKNAIQARDPPSPEEDPEFSPEDARYSVVRYVASTTRNAVGPSVSDPRTGEIIESDIIWYHNHLRSYRNRYLLETGAANPKARTLATPEEEIGEMMRRVISHEIGHALGLPHNMKASSAYPVDSLRSASFTQKYGIATTIMDYARYNYIAQPGDQNIRFIRQLGPYDHYAIKWGYTYLPDVSDPEDERDSLKQWIMNKSGDPVYMFGSGFPRTDPRSQTECIGDDNILASEYGLRNLQFVAGNLVTWTSSDGQNYDDLKELYGELLGVYRRYIGHVIANVGGVYQTLITTDQAGTPYNPVDIDKQREAINFLNEHLFTTQKWLMPEKILTRINSNGDISRVSEIQTRYLESLLSVNRLNRMLEYEFRRSDLTYSVHELFGSIKEHLWRENHQPDQLDRVLQRSFIEALEKFLITPETQLSDLGMLSKSALNQIAETIKEKLNDEKSPFLQSHYQDLIERTMLILDPVSSSKGG